MTNPVPENHVTAEGRSVRAAIDAAAEQLGVPAVQVEHKIDMAHFRSAQGAGIGADTVRIFAWAKDPAELAPVLAAEEWVKGLLAAMDRTGTVRAERRGNGVRVHVDVGEAGGHLVGRGGTTLRAIQYLLELTLADRFPGVSVQLDVARAEADEAPRRDDDRPQRDDDRPRDDRPRDDRPRRDDDRGPPRGPPREARSDRNDRGGPPPRRDDRGGRGDRRGGDDRRPRGEDRPRRSDADIEELQRLARKIAERVVETGEAELIRRELNSFERRMVHTEISSMTGVRSRSVGEGYDRRIEILPSNGEDAPQDE